MKLSGVEKHDSTSRETFMKLWDLKVERFSFRRVQMEIGRTLGQGLAARFDLAGLARIVSQHPAVIAVV